MNRMKQLRNENNINQDVLAKLLGLEIAGVSKLETGRVPLKDEYIIKLADFFNVSTDFLLNKSDVRNVESSKKNTNKIEIDISINDYTHITDDQKRQIEDFARFVLKDNKKS